VEIRFMGMMIEIIKIVIVPIGAALIHDYLKTASGGARLRFRVGAVACAIVSGLLFLSLAPPSLAADGPRVAVELAAFVLGAVAFGVAYHELTRSLPRLESLMPLLSMAGIVYFTTVTTAAGRDNLLLVGGLLFLVAVLHNGAGYFLGYWLARLTGLDTASCRTVAIEVGLQNGGMASGIAGAMGKLATVGLAAAVFSPWMNISGSILANHWRRRPPQ
jgi:bile acid:Na+ symporter, BASS family